VGSLARRIQSNREWLVPWLQRGAALVLALLGLRRIGLVDDGLALASSAFVTTLLALRSSFEARRRARRLTTIKIKIARREVSPSD
jgi:hypothetical protein